tara:strand:+ start:972 stop:1124 length:153 start_codon:yes stop_codon:yes gene_type:complete
MGLIADSLREVLAQMEESDAKLQELINEFVTSSGELLEEQKTLIEKSIEK